MCELCTRALCVCVRVCDSYQCARFHFLCARSLCSHHTMNYEFTLCNKFINMFVHVISYFFSLMEHFFRITIYIIHLNCSTTCSFTISIAKPGRFPCRRNNGRICAPRRSHCGRSASEHGFAAAGTFPQIPNARRTRPHCAAELQPHQQRNVPVFGEYSCTHSAGSSSPQFGIAN